MSDYHFADPPDSDLRISLRRPHANDWPLGCFEIDPTRRDQDGRYLIELSESEVEHVRSRLLLSDSYITDLEAPPLTMERKVEIVNTWVSRQVADLNERKAGMSRQEAMESFRLLKEDHRSLLQATGVVTN